MKRLRYFFSLGLLLCAFSMSNGYAADSEPNKSTDGADGFFDDAENDQVTVQNREAGCCHHHHHHHCHDEISRSRRNDIIVEVQQRFYEFQDATSELKRVGRDLSNPQLLQAALDRFISFIDPNFSLYQFITVGITFGFDNITEIRNGYAGFAVGFNGYSQHFATNVVVRPSRRSSGLYAFMTSGGGEYASINPTTPFEQTTLSNWRVVWVWLEDGPSGPNWYITRYTEIGNRLFRFCPPCGPYTLFFARDFPGSTPVPTVPSCAACPAP